jgi:hypothetical protein
MSFRTTVLYFVEETLFFLFCNRKPTYSNFPPPTGGGGVYILPHFVFSAYDEAFRTYSGRTSGSTCICIFSFQVYYTLLCWCYVFCGEVCIGNKMLRVRIRVYGFLSRVCTIN